MNKDVVFRIGLSVFIMILSYIFVAYSIMDFNPGNWSVETRSIQIFITIIIVIIMATYPNKYIK